jgi:hypothetical protein
VALSANPIFSANNAGGAKRPKNLRFFSGAHRSVIGKNILHSEKPLFQQPKNQLLRAPQFLLTHNCLASILALLKSEFLPNSQDRYRALDDTIEKWVVMSTPTGHSDNESKTTDSKVLAKGMQGFGLTHISFVPAIMLKACTRRSWPVLRWSQFLADWSLTRNPRSMRPLQTLES